MGTYTPIEFYHHITTHTLLRAINAMWRFICAETIVAAALLATRGHLDQPVAAIFVIALYAVGTYPQSEVQR